MGLTTNQLIEQIKRDASIPASQIKYQNVDFIAFLNNAMESKLIPQLISVDQDFFVNYKDIPLVASQSSYRLPDMAVCWVIHEIGYVTSAGDYRVLPRLTRGTEQKNNTSSEPSGFYLQDGSVIVAPSTSTIPSGCLRIYYYRRQNDLTLITNCGKVTNVADGGLDYVITVDTAPVGTSVGADFIKGSSPYELICVDSTITLVGTTITVSKSGFSSIPEVGDYVAQTGFTPIPHIPDAWHYILASYAARKCLIGNGDEKILQLLDTEIASYLQNLKQVVKNRAKGSPKKRVSRNPFLTLSRRR